MFIGLQKGRVVSIKETREEIEAVPLMVFDEIQETTDTYTLVNGEYRINGAKTEEEIRVERDKAINSILWRVERYNQQKQLGIETTDSESEYIAILQYIQYLRDVPAQPDFPSVELLSFEDWNKK